MVSGRPESGLLSFTSPKFLDRQWIKNALKISYAHVVSLSGRFPRLTFKEDCFMPVFPLAAPRVVAIKGYQTYLPENCPFETVIVDVTHRCNMGCRNCYIPNRTIQDLDADWLATIFSRLPRGTYVRLVGGEPTMRDDLPQLIRQVRQHGHHPVILTNGLKLANRAYVRELKQAGLQIAYLSLNGGFQEELYVAIDAMSCLEQKTKAFDNLCAEYIFTSIGMIIVRGVNEHAVEQILTAIRAARN